MSDASKLKIVIVGHVDHGKSTLIGRLFHDTNSLPEGKEEQIRKACEAEGMDFEYAFLLDALLEEQEQNITIDTTQIQFRTEARPYVIIDAPGHKEFLKNMVTGAASADAAILLIDAAEGVREQSRRHGYLLSLLGIKQIIVAVNKMDLVDFDQEVFNRIENEYREFLRSINVEPRLFIPVSARDGHNIVKASERMPWYSGNSILTALDSFDPPPNQEKLPLRLQVQDIYRFDERRIIAGRIEAGTLKVGDELIFFPDRKRSVVKTIEWWNSKEPKTELIAGESAAITLEEQIFAERGQIASHLHDSPAEAREFSANIFWLFDEPLALNGTYTMKLGAQEVEARLVQIERVMDSSTLTPSEDTRVEIGKNECAQVRLRVRRPIAFDDADKITETGRFVLLHSGRIGGGGIIFDAPYASRTNQAVKSGNISWSVGTVTRELRQSHFGHSGGVIWLTGLSGSGKSTLATALEGALFERGIGAFVLDGDNLRHGLCGDLGFSEEDRTENIRRAGEAAKLLAEAGMVVISALISPFRGDRDQVRESCEAGGIPFREVYINAPLEVCEQRDPKKLYQRARAGEITGFTGIDSPYEAPQAPELEVRTDQLSKEEALSELLHMANEMAVAQPNMRAEDQMPSGNI